MSNRLVSAVIPVYNGEEHVIECIASVRSQTHKAIEIIVIDDGSTDSTLSLVQYLEGVRVFCQRNSGANAARNYGLKEAKGEYVKFLDADDVLYDRYVIQEQVEQFQLLKKKQIPYGFFFRRGLGGDRLMGHCPNDRDLDSIAKVIQSNIGTSTPLHRKSYLQEIGGFNANLTARQEWDLHIRLAISGVNFVYFDMPIYVQNIHASPTRISNRRFDLKNEWKNIQHVQDVILSRPQVNREEIDAFAGFVWNLGRVFMRTGDRDGAKWLFDKAIGLSHDGYYNNFSKVYRLLTFLLGPLVAEKFAMLLISIKGFMAYSRGV